MKTYLQGGPAANRDAAAIYGHAICVLKEWTQEGDEIFAIATAGHTYCDSDESIIQRNLFCVIEEKASSALLSNQLVRLIQELAACAGVPVETA